LFKALAGIWYHHHLAGEVELSLEVANQLLHLAQSSEESVRLKFAHFAMAQSLWHLGDFILCAEHIRQSERIIGAEQRASSYHLGDAPPRWLAISANAFWQLDYPDQAMARSRDAIASADRISHGYVSAVTRMFCGLFCADSRYIQMALGHADAGMALASEYGFSPVLPVLMMQRGWALMHLGVVEEGFDQINQGVAVLLPTVRTGYYLNLRSLAEANLLAKRAEDGLRLASDGLQDLDNGKRRMEHAELYRLKGELLLLQNPDAQAEAEACL
jgi:hypothetical protein